MRLHRIKVPYKIPKWKTDAQKKEKLLNDVLITTEPHTMVEVGIGEINSNTNLEGIDMPRVTPELPDSVYTQKAKSLAMKKRLSMKPQRK